MNILEKEFVPYEPSLAFKELGFDEPCFGLWNLNNGKHEVDIIGVCKYSKEFKYREVLAPTFSQAFRWFREKYNIDAWVQPFVTEKSNGTPFLPDESYSYYIFKDGVFVADKVDLFDPEEAELACLKKLIEIVKKK